MQRIPCSMTVKYDMIGKKWTRIVDSFVQGFDVCRGKWCQQRWTDGTRPLVFKSWFDADTPRLWRSCGGGNSQKYPWSCTVGHCASMWSLAMKFMFSNTMMLINVNHICNYTIRDSGTRFQDLQYINEMGTHQAGPVVWGVLYMDINGDSRKFSTMDTVLKRMIQQSRHMKSKLNANVDGTWGLWTGGQRNRALHLGLWHPNCNMSTSWDPHLNDGCRGTNGSPKVHANWSFEFRPM